MENTEQSWTAGIKIIMPDDNIPATELLNLAYQHTTILHDAMKHLHSEYGFHRAYLNMFEYLIMLLDATREMIDEGK